MIRIEARRISRKIFERIESGFPPGSVSGIFDRSVNLETGDKFLIHVGTDRSPLTPRSIIIPGEDFSVRLRPRVCKGQRVFAEQGCILLPDCGICLSARSSPRFEPKLCWPAESLHLDEVRRNLVESMRWVQSTRTEEAPRSPLAGYFLGRVAAIESSAVGERSPFPVGGERAISLSVKNSLWARIDSLLAAMTGKTGNDLREIAKSIIGLGPGLTPSGDDFLAGFTSVGMALGTREGKIGAWAGRLANILLEEAKDRTTSLSGAMFEDASEGEMNEPALRFISSLLREEDLRQTRSYAREAASLGAFSGEDFLNGVAVGLVVFPGMVKDPPQKEA